MGGDEFALLFAGDGRQQLQLAALGQGEHGVDHLTDRLGLERQAE